jgi:hypothetical protein
VNISGFTKDSLDAVDALLYAEGQKNPYEGQCGQKKLREQNKQPRTPLQEQADQARSQALRGKSAASGNRSESAKKAAQTRRQCKGQTAQPETGVK